MSHPNPSHDPENVYPSDNYKPVQKKYHNKKKSMAKKMFDTHGSVMDVMIKSLRKSGKKGNWFKGGQGGGGLPPGRRDADNE